MIRNLWPLKIMCFFMFSFVISLKFIIFVSFYYIVTLISPFQLTRSLLVPYAYVSIESTDYIILPPFELKAILLISSIKTFCISLLNLCCVFKYLLFFMNYLISFLKLSTENLLSSRWFLLFSSCVTSKQILKFPN